MSNLTYHRSRPDRWSSPRPYSDPSLRALTYGKVQPMYEPSLLERLFGGR